jgi:toxic protein SymE
MINKTIRQIKLHSKYRCAYRGWTKGESETRIIPWLNISGLWLEEAGFQAGNQVEISVKHNQLVIRKIPGK